MTGALKNFVRTAPVLVLLIQLVPVERSNPPVAAAFAGPVEIAQVFRTACYNCHSNETRWPWYSYVAPVSWWLVHHVDEAREHLNFSDWGRLSSDKQSELRDEIWEEVRDGKMPLPSYRLMHRDARLSPQQVSVIEAWSKGIGTNHSQVARSAGN